jgi:hypothetical protein
MKKEDGFMNILRKLGLLLCKLGLHKYEIEFIEYGKSGICDVKEYELTCIEGKYIEKCVRCGKEREWKFG